MSATRVFVARLAGCSVFDPNGDQVGKVRDVLVVYRKREPSPRVVGIDRRGARQAPRVPVASDGSPASAPARSSPRASSTFAASSSAAARCASSPRCSGRKVTLRDGRGAAPHRGRRDRGARPRRVGGQPGVPAPAEDLGIPLRRRARPCSRRGRDVVEEHRPASPSRRPSSSRATPTCCPPTSRTRCSTCRSSACSRSRRSCRDERLADVLEEMPENEQVDILEPARRRPRRRRARPDAAGRRGRPHRAALRGARRDAARAHGARGGGRRALPAVLRPGHRGRPDDHRADHRVGRCHGRRGARAHPPARTRARRSALRSASPCRRTSRRPAASSAWCTSSGCCAIRRTSASARCSTRASSPCAPTPASPRCSRILASYNLVSVPLWTRATVWSGW